MSKDAESPTVKYFEIAADVRKFEIGLFWQRSLFFWGFIGAAFVAYADLGNRDNLDHAGQIIVACFGFVCSVAWTLLNRGSKYWQEAWEAKTERREGAVLGEDLFARDEPVQRKFILLRARRYSVSKLVIALSDFTALIWLLLSVRLLPWDSTSWPFASRAFQVFRSPFVTFAFAIFYAIYMGFACRSTRKRPTLLDLVGQLSSHFDPKDRGGIVIFGSSAIAMRGVDLSRPINDLDVFVSEKTFETLRSLFPLQKKAASEGGDVEFYSPEPKIEILKSFPGVTFDEIRERAAPISGSNGFPVAAVGYLIVWKTTQGREKDLKDLEAIEKHRQNGS
jgi:hypothetical protein